LRGFQWLAKLVKGVKFRDGVVAFTACFTVLQPFVRLLLVGHSMGGLAIRAALRVRGSTAGILGIVSLGTLHGGTSLAPWGFGAFRVPVVSIYSTHDNFVSPPQSARLRGAAHVAMPAVGHLTMCLSSRVEAKLVASLRSIEGGARTSGA